MVTRFGSNVPADAVFDAWTSHDLDAMRAVIGLRTNAVDRHHLLGVLVGELYKRREDVASREELFEVGHLHLRELPLLAQGLYQDRHQAYLKAKQRLSECAQLSGQPPKEVEPFDDRLWYYSVPTFWMLARAYCEVEQYDAARAVWNEAHRIGYLADASLARELDGIERNRRKKERAATAVAGVTGG